MLKADLHIHTSEDSYHPEIKYNAIKLIEYASQLGFDVLAITNHNKVTYNKNLRKIAEKNNILLLPGAELRIDGSDVLIYNITNKDIKKIKTFSDLKKLKKRKNVLIIAPHPFYLFNSLGKKLKKYLFLFDAIEYSHFYVKNLNAPNKKALRFAKENNKPVIGTSDAHHLWRINFTYTLIDSKKNISSLIRAIKNNRLKLVSRPLTIKNYIKVMVWIFFGIKRFINKKI
ncbi:MAG: PHP domain-containing protein [Candidatus Woesearchaeota archaeon]